MWPFSRKKLSAVPRRDYVPDALPFKSGTDFFEYQCEFGDCEVQKGKGLVALVLDSQKEFGTKSPVSIADSGIQTATLRVVPPDGGFITVAETASARGERLSPDDVVIWVPMTQVGRFGELFGDDRSTWVGVLAAKLRPEINTRSDRFIVTCEYV